MIYLEKDGVKASTNDEDVAVMFEGDGYTRIQGRRYLALVLGRAAKEVVLEWLVPVAVGFALFHFCEGRDYAAFVLGVYAAHITRNLLSAALPRE